MIANCDAIDRSIDPNIIAMAKRNGTTTHISPLWKYRRHERRCRRTSRRLTIWWRALKCRNAYLDINIASARCNDFFESSCLRGDTNAIKFQSLALAISPDGYRTGTLDSLKPQPVTKIKIQFSKRKYQSKRSWRTVFLSQEYLEFLSSYSEIKMRTIKTKSWHTKTTLSAALIIWHYTRRIDLFHIFSASELQLYSNSWTMAMLRTE